MQSINEIKTVLKKHLEDFNKKYNVKTLGIFGSYSRGDQTNESDLDIVVEFDQPIGLDFVDLADELEEILHTKVDLVSRNAIKSKYWAYIEKDVVYV